MSSNSSNRELARNVGYSTATTIVDALGALLINVLIGRLLGERPIGQYGYALAFASIVLTFTGLGLPSFAIQLIARKTERLEEWSEVARACLFGYVGIGLPSAMCILFVASSLWPQWIGSPGLLALATLSVVVSSTIGMTSACLHGLSDFKPGLWFSTLSRAGASLSVVVVAVLDQGMELFFILQALAAAISSVVLIKQLRRHGFRLWRRVPLDRFKGYLRDSLPFGLTTFVELIYFRADTVFVRWWLGEAQTGWYVAAYTLSLAPSAISYSAVRAMYPYIARHAAAQGNPVETQVLTTKLLAIYGVVVAVGIALLADWLVVFVYGPDLQEAAALLRILALNVPLVALNRLGVITFKGTGRVRLAAWASILAAAVAIGGNIAVIPVYGVQGVAWVGVATEATLMLCCWLFGAWKKRPGLNVGASA